MNDPLLSALLHDRNPVPEALLEARRTRRRRVLRSAAFAGSAALIAIVVSVQFLVTGPSQETAPAFRAFSTTEIPAQIAAFSTPQTGPQTSLFSSTGKTRLIRPIDDRTLFDLLRPYGPVIVHSDDGASLLLVRQP
jgi:hypothetical protein